MAKAIAAPGSMVTGEFDYDTDATISSESNPAIADYYYSPPNAFRLAVAVGEKVLPTNSSASYVWLSARILGRALGQPKLGLGADVTGDLGAWPGELDRLSVQLVLKAKDDALRLDGLPDSAALNALPLSRLSRLSLTGERFRDSDRPKHPQLWIVCGELISLVATSP
jgi:hypothetical protein